MPAKIPIRTLVAIVVSYNNFADLADCVNSLVRQRIPPDYDYKIVISDNNSTPAVRAKINAFLGELGGTGVRSLGAHTRSVSCVFRDANAGYAGAANFAIEHYSADAYIICNQDAVYREDFVSTLANYLQNNPNCGAATACVLFKHNPQIINSTANGLTKTGNGFDRGCGQPAALSADFPKEAEGFFGGACIIRAEAGRMVGFFDESYFMYYEDTDLSLRLRRAGWNINYVSSAVCFHAQAASSGALSPSFAYWNSRGRIFNLVRNLQNTHTFYLGLTAAFLSFFKSLFLSLITKGARRRFFAARILGVLHGFTKRTAPKTLHNTAHKLPTKPHKILLDFTPIPAQLGGVGRYAQGLAQGLHAVLAHPKHTYPSCCFPPQTPLHIFIVTKPTHFAHFQHIFHPNSTQITTRKTAVTFLYENCTPHAISHQITLIRAPKVINIRPLRMLWQQVSLPGLMRKLRCGTLHCIHYTFPARLSTILFGYLVGIWTRGTYSTGTFRKWHSTLVVTIHDATFFTHPDAHSKSKRIFFTFWTKLAQRVSHSTIMPSSTTTNQINKVTQITNSTRKTPTIIQSSPTYPPQVIHHGIDHATFAPPSPQAIDGFRTKYNLGDKKWIAYTGTIEPRKRLLHLLHAHAGLKKHMPDPPLLIIAGARGWDAEACAYLQSCAKDKSSKVLELGYIPTEDLPALMGGAQAFCYPSAEEGFGLPVLEAMSCGAVVVVHKLPIFKELAGGAVCYVEDFSPSPLGRCFTQKESTEALERCLLDICQNPAVYTPLRASATAHAEHYTWRRSAQEHIEVYTR